MNEDPPPYAEIGFPPSYEESSNQQASSILLGSSFPSAVSCTACHVALNQQQGFAPQQVGSAPHQGASAHHQGSYPGPQGSLPSQGNSTHYQGYSPNPPLEGSHPHRQSIFPMIDCRRSSNSEEHHHWLFRFVKNTKIVLIIGGIYVILFIIAKTGQLLQMDNHTYNHTANISVSDYYISSTQESGIDVTEE